MMAASILRPAWQRDVPPFTRQQGCQPSRPITILLTLATNLVPRISHPTAPWERGCLTTTFLLQNNVQNNIDVSSRSILRLVQVESEIILGITGNIQGTHSPKRISRFFLF